MSPGRHLASPSDSMVHHNNNNNNNKRKLDLDDDLDDSDPIPRKHVITQQVSYVLMEENVEDMASDSEVSVFIQLSN